MDNHLLRALKIRPFLFLWLAEICSQIAMNMMNFILILVAFSLTNSNTAVSGIVLCFTIPAIFFGVLAGVYVDRWNKITVLIITNILRALFLLLLAFFYKNLLALYAFTFIITIITQFFIPAETPIIPRIVGKNLIFSANALFGIGLYGSILIAYGLSGPFLLTFGVTNAFMLLSVFFLLATFFIFLMRRSVKIIPTEENREKKTTIGQEVKAALSLIVKIKEIYHSFFLLVLLQVLILVISVIGPGYARHILRIRIQEFPILFVTPAAFGMIIGAILLTTLFHNFPKRRSATIGILVSGITMFLLPYGSRVESRAIVHTINHILPHILRLTALHIMVVLAFVTGVGSSLIFVPSNTILQEQTSDEIRGKVYGTLNTFIAISSIFPIILAGYAADLFGVKSVLISMGVIMAAIGVFRLVTD